MQRFLGFVFVAAALLVAGASGQTAAPLNLSADLVRLGIAAGNMVPNQSTLDSGPLLENAMRYAVRNQIARVVAEPGAYYFLSASTTASGAHVAFSGPSATAPALTLDFQGSDLNFARADKHGFFLTGGTNLTVQNCTIDHMRPRYTQLLVTAVDAVQRQIAFAVQPGWQSPTGLNTLFESPGTEADVYVFRNGQPWLGFTQMAVAQPLNANALSITTAAALVPESTIAAIRPGDIAVPHLRGGGHGILASNLVNCTLRNIRIYSGFVGVRLVAPSGTLLERVAVMPKPGTDRLISTVADGIQISQPGPNNVVRLCRAIRTCDDGFSPNVFAYGSVQATPTARTVQVQGDPATALADNYALPNGTNVAFERASDGVIIATAVVVAQATAPNLGNLKQVVLTLDRDVPALAGTYVYATDAHLRGGNLLLERNTVQQQGWARGMSLWGLMDAKLHGNYIHRSAFAGIDIRHQLRVGDWIVPPTVNLTLTHNVIDGAITAPDFHSVTQLGGIEAVATNSTQQPMTASPHQNITLRDNVIAEPARAGIFLAHTTGGAIEGNYLLNPNDSPNVALGYAPYRSLLTRPLVVEASTGVTVGANLIDLVSRRAFVTDGEFRALAAHAPGATVQLNAFALGSLANPTLTLTDADGRAWTLSVTGTTPHALQAQVPAAAALGGGTIAIKAGGASYLATLFIDSQDNVPSLNQPIFLVSPATTTVAADATSVSFLVIAPAGAAYQTSSRNAFVTAPAGANGPGVITFTIARNAGPARTAIVEVAGQPITLAQAGATDPVIVAAPQSQGVKAGAAATFTVSAPGAQSYQWNLNGTAIAGATTASHTVGAVTAVQIGTYSVTVRNAAGASTTSAGALLVLEVEPPPAATMSRLSNLSILATVSAADPLFTLGTSIGGAGTSGGKALLVRVGGPSLGALGVSDTLHDPKLDVFSGQTVIATNDNWGGTASLVSAFTTVGAFPYIATDSRDAAHFAPSLEPGSYTIQVSGVGGATGTVIAELYDSTPDVQLNATTPRLVNVSVLKRIGAGEVLTAGFVISGASPKRVLIRAVGPALGLPPFNLAGVMSDPKLELFSERTVVARNDNWETPVGADAATAANLAAAFSGVGAFALPAGSRDAALLVTLNPGNYTAQASAVATGGQAIVEVYEVPQP